MGKIPEQIQKGWAPVGQLEVPASQRVKVGPDAESVTPVTKNPPGASPTIDAVNIRELDK